MIFFNNPTKQKFNMLLENATLIYNETLSCLQPVADTYWHYFFVTQSRYQPLTISLKDIKTSMSTFLTYCEQLNKLNLEIINTYNCSSKHLSKQKPQMQKINNWVDEFLFQINNWHKTILQLPNYAYYPELKFIMQQLEVIKRALKNYKVQNNNVNLTL